MDEPIGLPNGRRSGTILVHFDCDVPFRVFREPAMFCEA